MHAPEGKQTETPFYHDYNNHLPIIVQPVAQIKTVQLTGLGICTVARFLFGQPKSLTTEENSSKELFSVITTVSCGEQRRNPHSSSQSFQYLQYHLFCRNHEL